MHDAASYAACERLRDGRPVEIRALQPDDEASMLAAVERTSLESLQRRFFTAKRSFSENECAYFIDVDFRNHVALVARIDQDGESAIIGGGRYIVIEPGRAEMAFVVVDAWQGKGVGSLLLRHLVNIARDAGLRELTAEVLPENTPMLKTFAKRGFKPVPHSDFRTVRLSLAIAAKQFPPPGATR